MIVWLCWWLLWLLWLLWLFWVTYATLVWRFLLFASPFHQLARWTTCYQAALRLQHDGETNPTKVRQCQWHCLGSVVAALPAWLLLLGLGLGAWMGGGGGGGSSSLGWWYASHSVCKLWSC